MRCMKKMQRQKASTHWSAARNKERPSSRGETANELHVNRSLFSPIGLHRILFVQASETHSGHLSSMRWEARRSVVSWADRSAGVLSCPVSPSPDARTCAALPYRTAVRRPASTRSGMSGFRVRRVNMKPNRVPWSAFGHKFVSSNLGALLLSSWLV